MVSGKLRLGQLVTSRAGRDTGERYLVVGKTGDRFVFLANGKTRTLANPKKKNLRHLVFHQAVVEDIERKLEAGEEVKDEEIRQALARLEVEK